MRHFKADGRGGGKGVQILKKVINQRGGGGVPNFKNRSLLLPKGFHLEFLRHQFLAPTYSSPSLAARKSYKTDYKKN